MLNSFYKKGYYDMKKIKKGDIVGRLSYGKDILFIVERIIKTKENHDLAILKGLTIRIQADSPIDDLELIEPKAIEQDMRNQDAKVIKRIKKQEKLLKINSYPFREKIIIYTGRILHIDGDKRYSEKSRKYYRKLGLNAIVKSVPERKQPIYVGSFLQRYNPDFGSYWT